REYGRLLADSIAGIGMVAVVPQQGIAVRDHARVILRRNARKRVSGLAGVDGLVEAVYLGTGRGQPSRGSGRRTERDLGGRRPRRRRVQLYVLARRVGLRKGQGRSAHGSRRRGLAGIGSYLGDGGHRLWRRRD